MNWYQLNIALPTIFMMDRVRRLFNLFGDRERQVRRGREESVRMLSPHIYAVFCVGVLGFPEGKTQATIIIIVLHKNDSRA